VFGGLTARGAHVQAAAGLLASSRRQQFAHLAAHAEHVVAGDRLG
jgi:hypothetical protein